MSAFSAWETPLIMTYNTKEEGQVLSILCSRHLCDIQVGLWAGSLGLKLELGKHEN